MKIERIIDDLNKEVWYFWVNNNEIYLNSYDKMTRKSKRHKYVSIQKYDRLISRDNTISEEQVPFDNELREKVRSEYCKNISVIKWSERRK